jgi:hypothetical protein
MRSLICDADCPATFGPVDLLSLRAVRREAKRDGWALRFISYHGNTKLADLCPEHTDVREVT